ncbi:MAG TPA: ABATE domain-containing protein, partial [Actinomycetota bacterium]|nr:ABATE domain-containing protein [Actinomycetota bacterium]
GRGRGTGDQLVDEASLRRFIGDERDRLGQVAAGAVPRLVHVRAVRRAVVALFDAAVRGDPLPATFLATVNAASAAAPVALRLDPEAPAGGSLALRDALPMGPGTVLGALARSAVGLLGGPDRDRLARCGAPGCGRFFLRNRGGQVWCSKACGTRARVARHHARRRAMTREHLPGRSARWRSSTGPS